MFESKISHAKSVLACHTGQASQETQVNQAGQNMPGWPSWAWLARMAGLARAGLANQRRPGRQNLPNKPIEPNAFIQNEPYPKLTKTWQNPLDGSGRLWTALDGTPTYGPKILLDGSGRLWTALDGSGRHRCLLAANGKDQHTPSPSRGLT